MWGRKNSAKEQSQSTDTELLTIQSSGSGDYYQLEEQQNHGTGNNGSTRAISWKRVISVGGVLGVVVVLTMLGVANIIPNPFHNSSSSSPVEQDNQQTSTLYDKIMSSSSAQQSSSGGSVVYMNLRLDEQVLGSVFTNVKQYTDLPQLNLNNAQISMQSQKNTPSKGDVARQYVEIKATTTDFFDQKNADVHLHLLYQDGSLVFFMKSKASSLSTNVVNLPSKGMYIYD